MNTREFARKLRKESTDAERRLWAVLRDRRLRGFKFRRQYARDPYVLDFYCPEAKLAVEADGGQHFQRLGQSRDAERTRFLESEDIRVMRFTNLEILRQRARVLESILEALQTSKN